MAAKSSSFFFKKLRVLVWAAIMVLCLTWAAVSSARPTFVIRDLTVGSDLDLLPAASWPLPHQEHEGMVIKLSYLRGIIDALQMTQVAPRTSAQVLKKLKGLDLNQLAAAIDRYYLVAPRRRELAPASVLLRILPQATDRPGRAPIPRGK